MIATLSTAEAREHFIQLPEQFEKEPELTVQSDAVRSASNRGALVGEV